MNNNIKFDLITSLTPYKFNNSKQTFFYQSLYMIKGNSRYFVKKVPIIKNMVDRSLANFFAIKIEELDRAKNFLLGSQGRFLKFMGNHLSPIELLEHHKVVPDKTMDSVLQDSKKGYWDFKGIKLNTNEEFHYRIFDEDIIKEIENKLNQ